MGDRTAFSAVVYKKNYDAQLQSRANEPGFASHRPLITCNRKVPCCSCACQTWGLALREIALDGSLCVDFVIKYESKNRFAQMFFLQKLVLEPL